MDFLHKPNILGWDIFEADDIFSRVGQHLHPIGGCIVLIAIRFRMWQMTIVSLDGPCFICLNMATSALQFCLYVLWSGISRGWGWGEQTRRHIETLGGCFIYTMFLHTILLCIVREGNQIHSLSSVNRYHVKNYMRLDSPNVAIYWPLEGKHKWWYAHKAQNLTLRQLYLEERAPAIHWMGGWVFVRTYLDAKGETHASTGNRTPVFSP